MANPTIDKKYLNVENGDIIISKHCIIGSNSIILPNVTLFEGTAVGSLSLIKHNTEEWNIYGGIPAKIIKKRSKKCLEYEKEIECTKKPQFVKYIRWVNEKKIDHNKIIDKIDKCIATRIFTNNGINVINLQDKIKEIFKIDNSKDLLMTCNGSMGINAIIGGLNTFFNKKLKFCVQSFTFPCSKQGPLQDSIVVDIDTEHFGPSITELNEYKDQYDGILVTNCFGCSTNIEVYENFCKNNNKLLIFDNAATPYTFYQNKNLLNKGSCCMVSLHHTKSIGFGEGGFIVFDKKYLDVMKKTICFGYTETNKSVYNVNASNYKMSEINAIYTYEYLLNLNKIYEHHISIIIYFIDQLKIKNLNNKVKLFKNFSNYNESLLSTIPLVFNKPQSVDFF